MVAPGQAGQSLHGGVAAVARRGPIWLRGGRLQGVGTTGQAAPGVRGSCGTVDSWVRAGSLDRAGTGV